MDRDVALDRCDRVESSRRRNKADELDIGAIVR
jgi:hypothetical protein